MKKTVIIVGILAGILIIAEVAIGLYFFKFAVSTSKKPFIAENHELDKTSALYSDKIWFRDTAKRLTWTQKSNDDLKLVATYLPAEKKSNKTVIIAHGFMGQSEDMGAYAALFYRMGYNVLMPDARGHGKSQGDYIGYGWPERKDYQLWIKQIIEKNGQNSQIVLYGVSMGAATVMMTSGEKLPTNVKAVIEDCGYTSAKDELIYQQKEMFPKIPTFLTIPITSLITKIKVGYFFGEASAVKQVEKSTLPTFFIHGGKDTFVPTNMVYTLYDAHINGPRELYVVKGAEHAGALKADPQKYAQKVETFLNSYVQ